jgi:nucleotide-binding universal stress UspA family protein
MRTPLVVGVDGTHASLFGLEEAITLAEQMRSALVVVFVRPDDYQTWSGLGSSGVFYIGDMTDKWQTVTEAQCIAILDSTSIDWNLHVRSGEPAVALMTAAREVGADTIVVSGRRHGFVGSIAHGAIATKLLHRWPGTLIAVHPPSLPTSAL